MAMGWCVSHGIPNEYTLPLFDADAMMVTSIGQPFNWRPWNPITDANARDEVVGRMAELGYRVTMTQITRQPRWLVVFEDAVSEKKVAEAYRTDGDSLTLGRAVLEAALAAVRAG